MELLDYQTKTKLKTIDILDPMGDLLTLISVKSGERHIKEGIITITPAMAILLLDKIKNNRKVKDANVLFLSKEILEGRWVLNGESLSFTRSGEMINGEHRLRAVIKANRPIRTKITYGIDEATRTTIDTGSKRIAKDCFDMINVHNSSLVSGGIKLIHQFNNGSYGEMGGSSRILSNQETLDYYLDNTDELEISVSMANTLYKKCNHIISTNIIMALHFLFAKKSRHQANDFFEKICTGSELTSTSPILVLRNKLIKNLSEPKHKMSQKEKVEYLIFTWNKYRNGETCKTLKLPTEAPLKIK